LAGSFCSPVCYSTAAIAYSRLDPQRARIDTLWINHRRTVGGFFVALTLVVGALARARI
jgi:hypothetical protein